MVTAGLNFGETEVGQSVRPVSGGLGLWMGQV